MEKTKAVVLGRNYTSLLSMIRAAGLAGCEVTVVKTVKKIPSKKRTSSLSPEFYSKYVVDYKYSKEPDSEGLVNLLLKLFEGQKNVVLLPTDDYVASTIDMNQNKLKENFVFPHLRHQQGAVVQLMDKDVQKDLARKNGLKVAAGWVAQIEDGKFSIPEGIEYPVFTKPQISFYGNKKCMKCCNNEKELIEVLQEVAKEGNCPILIEQYIEIEKEYGVLGYCDENQVITPCLVDKIEIGNGSHKGVTMIGQVSPFEKSKPDVYEKIQNFLKSTGFTGLIDIDLYESKGIVYFNELNLRLGAFGFASVCAGINLPQLLIENLLNGKLPDTKLKMDETITCLSDKVLYDDYFEGFMSKKSLKHKLKQADFSFINSPNDPKPYKIFKLKNNLVMIKKLIKH